MIPGQAYEGAKARCVQTAFIVLLLVALLFTVFRFGAEAPHLRRTWCPACRPGTDTITGVPVPTNYTGRYAFIDLGANRADTLWVFLGRPGSKFTFNFSTPNDGRSHEDAEIFLFEANPLFNMDLVRARQWGLRRGMDIQIFPSHIVHTADTTMDFYVDNVTSVHDFWGSSVQPSHEARNRYPKVLLTAVNLANFLLTRFVPDDYVVVKMDIEAAEFDILPHLHANGVSEIVDVMYVEWHHAKNSVTEEQKVAGQAAQVAMMTQGTRFPEYNSPA